MDKLKRNMMNWKVKIKGIWKKTTTNNMVENNKILRGYQTGQIEDYEILPNNKNEKN